jgi:hypothetical protein
VHGAKSFFPIECEITSLKLVVELLPDTSQLEIVIELLLDTTQLE